MKRMALLAAAVCAPLGAQLVPAGEGGITMGHLHLNARDPGAQRTFWLAMGATPVQVGPLEALKLPGAYVFVRKQEPSAGTEGSTVNHIGLRVPDLRGSLAKWRAAGLRLAGSPPGSTTQAFLMAPDNVRVEITEDRGLGVPVAIHHIHFYGLPPEDAKAWYAKAFGAVPGRRGRFEAADLPGVNLSFSPGERAAGTKGRALDHIGFEVRGLEAFCRKLEASGMKFDVPYRVLPSLGVAVAFLTDPWGTYIELTEGLDKL